MELIFLYRALAYIYIYSIYIRIHNLRILYSTAYFYCDYISLRIWRKDVGANVLGKIYISRKSKLFKTNFEFKLLNVGTICLKKYVYRLIFFMAPLRIYKKVDYRSIDTFAPKSAHQYQLFSHNFRRDFQIS